MPCTLQLGQLHASERDRARERAHFLPTSSPGVISYSFSLLSLSLLPSVSSHRDRIPPPRCPFVVYHILHLTVTMFAARQSFGFLQKRAFSASASQVCRYLRAFVFGVPRRYHSKQYTYCLAQSLGLQGRCPRCRWWYRTAPVPSPQAQPSRV